ncbi:hypothetical protein ACFX2G_044690 [Malus domestica]
MPKRKGSYQLSIDIPEFVWTFSLLVGEGFLEAVDDRLVGCFGLPITLRIPRRGHVLLDTILLEELPQIFAHELWAVVDNDGLRDDKLGNMFLHMKHFMSV